MRKPLIVGNWKMNNSVAESVSLVDKLKVLAKDVAGVEIVVAPPFTALKRSKNVSSSSCRTSRRGSFTFVSLGKPTNLR